MMPVPDTAKNRRRCLCPKCPSFPQGCTREILFCAHGESQCDINARGCLCPGCPVWFEYKLKDIYFCSKERVGESSTWMRKKKTNEDPTFYQTLTDIKDQAETGESVVVSMGSTGKLPFSFSDLHFIPAQVAKIPLNREEKVGTKTTIGPKAKRPLVLSSPVMISGMSFGATSKNVKLVISAVCQKLKIGFNSGEGGLLPEDLEASKYLIGQYATGRFGINEEILKKVAAVEIRFGQGAYPGKGSYLPAEKMTAEVAKLRGLKGEEAAYSPAHHHDMTTPSEIKEKIKWLKELTQGVPIGAKIGCGNIEEDIKILVKAGVDFIAIDGFGGGTGATDKYVRDNVGLPLVAALPRATTILEQLGVKDKVSLIASGGLRTSADFAKCLALGADAVYVGTAALIAINCQQFKICHTGFCPTGVTTHDGTLTEQLDVKEGIRKLTNFLKVTTEEIATLTRVVGKDTVKKLNREDLVSLNHDLSLLTGVQWLDGTRTKQR